MTCLDSEHERMISDIADDVREHLKRNHNAVYLLILDIEAGLIPGLHLGPWFTSTRARSRTGRQCPACPPNHNPETAMPLGYTNPQERDWRDALDDWLETATDEDLYSTLWEILLEPRSMFDDMTHQRAIEEEIQRRNTTGFHR